ncbi:hypothetical protein [Streptomyces rubellomurinus]|uniref:Mur ligase central domain-containing protein n=2 Tax=Streptomyces TaxID=1883 RepID=A0A0F2T915_STRR3|nr:hypothetical protein [Streptomyces rubellomurinus]KJS59693.1 hypothetical protein VM95_25585 [Streptomyces rubellomurinus]
MKAAPAGRAARGFRCPRPLPDVLIAPHVVDPHSPGMAGLASYLARRGARVTVAPQQDGREDELLQRLARAGAVLQPVVPGVTTALLWGGHGAAVHEILDRATGQGLPSMGYSRALELLGGTAPTVVAVVGSHSTTMAAAALTCALTARDPGWILTAAPHGDAPGYDGSGDVLVVDLCPDTALHEAAPPGWRHRTLGSGLHPAVTLVTAVDTAPPMFATREDALDDIEALARSSESVVVWAGQPGCDELLERLRRAPGPRVVTVGRGQGMDVQILRLLWSGEDHHLTIQAGGERVSLTVPIAGTTSALGVAAAFAAGWALGVSGSDLVDGLGAFTGAERSLTRLGTVGRVTVMESRAQHPEEIAADLQGARMLTEGAVIAVFEPVGHLRTGALAERITAALAAADHTVLLPVLSTPARPQLHLDGIAALASASDGVGGQDGGALVIPEPGPCEMGAEEVAASLARADDVILTIGSEGARRSGPRLLAALDRAAQ